MMFQRYAQILVVLFSASLVRSSKTDTNDNNPKSSVKQELTTQFEKQVELLGWSLKEIKDNWNTACNLGGWESYGRQEKEIILDDESKKYRIIERFKSSINKDTTYETYFVFVIDENNVYYTSKSVDQIKKNGRKIPTNTRYGKILTKAYQERKRQEGAEKEKEKEEKAIQSQMEKLDIYDTDGSSKVTLTRNGKDFILKRATGELSLSKGDFGKLIAAYDAEIKKTRAYLDLGTEAMVFEKNKSTTNLGANNIDLKTIKLCRRAMTDKIWFQLTE